MTASRDQAERGVDGSSRRRRGPETSGGRRGLLLAASLAAVALVLSGVALLVTLTRPVPATDESCRLVAWNAVPVSDELPSGMTMTASGFYTDGYGASFSGPVASGEASGPAMNVRVSCYGADGAAAIVRSHDSDLSLGGTDLPFGDVGDQVLATVDAAGTTTSVYIRRGPLVASISAQGLSSDDLDQAAAAVDDAMVAAESTGGRPSVGSSTAAATPTSLASQGPVPSPTDSHAFPDLEAVLPATVGGTPMSKQSTTASTALAGDPSSDALLQWLSGLGKKPQDLEIAADYDPTSTVDADFTAFRLKGIAASDLRQALLKSWLSANASGITTTNQTISGTPVIVIDYGDQGSKDYVYERGDAVVILSSSDPALVAQILAGSK